MTQEKETLERLRVEYQLIEAPESLAKTIFTRVVLHSKASRQASLPYAQMVFPCLAIVVTVLFIWRPSEDAKHPFPVSSTNNNTYVLPQIELPSENLFITSDFSYGISSGIPFIPSFNNLKIEP